VIPRLLILGRAPLIAIIVALILPWSRATATVGAFVAAVAIVIRRGWSSRTRRAPVAVIGGGWLRAPGASWLVIRATGAIGIRRAALPVAAIPITLVRVGVGIARGAAALEASAARVRTTAWRRTQTTGRARIIQRVVTWIRRLRRGVFAAGVILAIGA